MPETIKCESASMSNLVYPFQPTCFHELQILHYPDTSHGIQCPVNADLTRRHLFVPKVYRKDEKDATFS